jgi:hypothetical protein
VRQRPNRSALHNSSTCTHCADIQLAADGNHWSAPCICEFVQQPSKQHGAHAYVCRSIQIDRPANSCELHTRCVLDRYDCKTGSCCHHERTSKLEMSGSGEGRSCSTTSAAYPAAAKLFPALLKRDLTPPNPGMTMTRGAWELILRRGWYKSAVIGTSPEPSSGSWMSKVRSTLTRRDGPDLPVVASAPDPCKCSA